MDIIPDYFTETSEEIVEMVTLNQFNSITDMYNNWLVSNAVPEPSALAYLLSIFFVLIKFAVPAILVYFFALKHLTKHHGIRLTILAIIMVAYATFYINPLTVYEKFTLGINNFYYFLLALPSIETDPLIFTFLSNGVPVFIMKAVTCFLGILALFSFILGMSTILFSIANYGNSPWSYTDKKFMPFAIRIAIIFMAVYPLFGAFKTFLAIIAIVVGSIQFREGYKLMTGHEKHCNYDERNGRTICEWVK